MAAMTCVKSQYCANIYNSDTRQKCYDDLQKNSNQTGKRNNFRTQQLFPTGKRLLNHYLENGVIHLISNEAKREACSQKKFNYSK